MAQIDFGRECDVFAFGYVVIHQLFLSGVV